jgi:hypothetical protein
VAGDRDRNALWQAALWPLIGVIVGALITGTFQMVTQRAAAEQATRIEGVQASRELAIDYSDAAADYLADLSFVMSFPYPGHSLESSGADAEADRLERSSARVVMKSPPELAAAILTADSEAKLHFAGASKHSSNDRIELYGDTLLALYGQAWEYRVGSTPTGVRDELLREVLRSLEASAAVAK